jgi:phenylacetate-CoA ligase
MLFGYPSSIALIAAHARSRGARMENLGVRVVFVTSERLYDQQRDTIESVFNCPVANGYGGRDAGFIAHQCPAGGMHVSAEDIIVEILDDTGAPVQPGEAGEIVVTHMATGDFPFVRYQTGDVGVLDDQPCRCGRSLPVIREIQGRSTDFVVAADGTIMHGLALIYVLRDLEGIRSFKIIQHDLLHTEVLLVAPDRSPSLEAHVRQQFQRRLGEAVQISLRFVNEIPREASGKYRYIVSHVARSQIGPTQTERKVAHA